MKKLLTIFALLCMSAVGWATEWTGQVTGTATNVWLDGIGSNDNRTTVNYAVNYQVGYSSGTLTVTIGYTDDNFDKTVGLVPQVFVGNGYKGNFSSNSWSSTDYSTGDELSIYFYFAYNGGASASSSFNYTVPSDAGGGGGGSTPEGEKFDPANASINSVYIAPGWAEDAASEATVAYNSTTGVISATILNALNAQWQGQIKFNEGVTYSAGKYYDFSIKFHASKGIGGVTIKIDDNTGMLLENASITLPADEDYVYTKSDVEGVAGGNGIIVFDFGWAPANTDITISEISIIEKDAPSSSDPEGEGINWDSYSWIENGTANVAYTEKYKMTVATGQAYVNIQQPGWADEAGIYTTFPAGVSDCDLPDGKYAIQSAGMVLYMSAFTARETEVTVTHGTGTAVFTVYYKDGVEGIASEYCAYEDPQTIKNGKNIALTWETNTNGDVVITMSNGTGATSCSFRNGGFEGGIGAFIVSTDDFATSEAASNYFTATQVYSGNTYTLTKTADLPANAKIKHVGSGHALAWVLDGNNEYCYPDFIYTYGGVCTATPVLTSIALSASGPIVALEGAGMALTAEPKNQFGGDFEAAVSFEITPAAAGHMSGNTFIPDQIGNATIRAYNGDIYSNAVVIAVYDGTNVALNKGDDDVTASGYDTGANLYPRFAVDADDGSQWSARVGETGDERVYDAWIAVDLGAYYDINLIAIRWEGACSKHYHVDFSEDGSTWRTAYEGGWSTVVTHWEYLIGTAVDATKVRYVRVWSTEAVSQYGVKIMALQVYATEWADSGDTEEPVMTSASPVSKTYNSAVIAVEATDNHEVARYHVVDGTNNIDANFVASDGKITVTGLSASTAYNFTITAKDIAGNESANNKVVAVTTNAYLSAPTAAATPPAWDAALVKAIYSPTYSADCNFANWGGCVAYTADTYGKKFVMGADCWGFGLDGYTLNCLNTEKLHADIWIADDASLRLVPIYGGDGLTTDDSHGKFVNLTGQQWNSIDLDLATDFAGLDLASIFQFKIDNANGLTIWVGNLYFYRETALADNEAPTSVSASIAAQGLYSVQITAQASDNSGSVNFSVRNGAAELATASAASGMTTTITLNNLTPGTTYNLNVLAYDDAGNEAAPVAVQATTKTLPASAPVDLNGKKVIPVFTDAVEGGKTNISSGGWGESTIVQWLNLTANDKVFYAQNFNWAGWHSWGADIDATDMLYLHVDIYSLGMTSVSITPISHDPTHEGAAAIALTPNAWTSVDIPLSTYDDANIEWNKIFQFKFMNPVGGNEFMADNVYFWQPVVKSNVDKWATFAASAAIKVPSGVTVYKAVHEVLGNEEVLRLTEIVSGVIPANTGALLQCETESATYAFTLATSDEADDAVGEFEGNSLVGCAVKTDISDIAATHDIYALRHSDAYGFSGFFLYSGTIVNAGKAYLPIEKDPATPASSRRLRFVYDTATDVENVQPAASGVQKVLKDGQLYILRDEVTYTIQGVRVE